MPTKTLFGRSFQKAAALTVVFSLLITDPLWASVVTAASQPMVSPSAPLSTNLFSEQALVSRLVNRFSPGVLNATEPTFSTLQSEGRSRRDFLKRLAASAAFAMMTSLRSIVASAQDKTSAPASAPLQGLTGLESITDGKWPNSNALPLGITSDFGANIDTVVREAISRSPEAKIAWEDLRTQTLELKALLQKHSQISFHTDPNHTVKLGVAPLEFIHDDFLFLLDPETRPRRRVETVEPDVQHGFWGKTVKWFEVFTGGVTFNSESLILADKLDIAQAMLNVSLAATHVVEVVDRVTDQTRQAWWVVAESDLLQTQQARTDDWLAGWKALYTSPAANNLQPQDAGATGVISAQGASAAQVAAAQQQRQLDENALLDVLQAGHQRRTDLSQRLIRPVLTVPGIDSHLLNVLGASLQPMDRDSFITLLTALVESTTPTDTQIENLRDAQKLAPTSAGQDALQLAVWKRQNLPEFQKRIQLLTGPADPRADHLLRQILLPHSLDEKLSDMAAPPTAEMQDPIWTSVIDAQSLDEAQPEGSPRQLLAKLRIAMHQLGREIVKVKNSSTWQISFKPQFNALIFISPFLLFAPSVSGQKKMSEEQIKLAQAKMNSLILQDQQQNKLEDEATQKVWNDARTKWLAHLTVARDKANEYTNQIAELQRQLTAAQGNRNNAVPTIEAIGTAFQAYQMALVEARHYWEIAWALTAKGREATRSDISQRIWTVVNPVAPVTPSSTGRVSRRQWFQRLAGTAAVYAVMAVAQQFALHIGVHQSEGLLDYPMAALQPIWTWITAHPAVSEAGLLLSGFSILLRRPVWLREHIVLRAVLGAVVGGLYLVTSPHEYMAAAAVGSLLFVLSFLSFSGTWLEEIYVRPWLTGILILAGLLTFLVVPINRWSPAAKRNIPILVKKSGVFDDDEPLKPVAADFKRSEPELAISAPAGEEGIIVAIHPLPPPAKRPAGSILDEPGVGELRAGGLYLAWEGTEAVTIPFNLNKAEKSNLYFVLGQVASALHDMGLKTGDTVEKTETHNRVIPGLDTLMARTRHTPASERFVVQSKKLPGSTEDQLISTIADFNNAYAQWCNAVRSREAAKQQAWAAAANVLQEQMKLMLAKWPTRNIRISRTAWLQTEGFPIRTSADLSCKEALKTGRLVGTSRGAIESNYPKNEAVTLIRLQDDARKNNKPTVVRFKVEGQREPWDVELRLVDQMGQPVRQVQSYDSHVITGAFAGSPFGQIAISLFLRLPEKYTQFALSRSVPQLTFEGFFPKPGAPAEYVLPLDAVPVGDTVGFATLGGYEEAPLRFPVADVLEGGEKALRREITLLHGVGALLDVNEKQFGGVQALGNLASTQNSQIDPLISQAMKASEALDGQITALDRKGALQASAVFGAPGQRRSLPAGIIPKDVDAWETYPLTSDQPFLGMPSVGDIRGPVEVAIKTEGDFTPAATLISPDGRETVTLDRNQTSHAQIQYNLSQTEVIAHLNADQHAHFFPPGTLSSFVHVRSGVSDSTSQSHFTETLKGYAERIRNFLKDKPIPTLILSMSLYKLMFFLDQHPLVRTADQNGVLNIWMVLGGIILVMLPWKSITAWLETWRASRVPATAPATDSVSQDDTVVPFAPSALASVIQTPRQKQKQKKSRQRRKISDADLAAGIHLMQGNPDLQLPPKWYPSEIAGGSEAIIVGLTQHAGLIGGAVSARRLTVWTRHVERASRKAERRTVYSTVMAWIMVGLTVVVYLFRHKIMQAMYYMVPLLATVQGGITVIIILIVFRELSTYLADIWLLSQASVGQLWVIKGWAMKRFWKINRLIEDFNMKMRDDEGPDVDAVPFIEQYLDPKLLSDVERAQFSHFLSQLANDLVPLVAYKLPENPNRLTATQRFLVYQFFQHDRQFSNSSSSLEETVSLNLPSNAAGLSDAQRVALVKEAMLDPQRQVLSLMILVENNLMNWVLAQRPGDSLLMAQAITAFTKRLQTLNHVSHDAYRRAFRLQQPWQLTQKMLEVIQSPPGYNPMARQAIVDAMKDVFTAEDALDILALAKDLRPETIPNNPELPRLMEGLQAIEQGGIGKFYVNLRHGKKINEGIRQVLEGFVADSSNEMAGVVAYVLARRLSLVDREKAEKLLEKLDSKWLLADPTSFLDESIPFLGPPPPVALMQANDLGTRDLNRILKDHAKVLGNGDIILSLSLMPSRRETWYLIRRLLKMTNGRIRIVSNSSSLDSLIQDLEKERVDRMGGEAWRVRFVESHKMVRVLRNARPNDLVISSAEPREWAAAANANAYRLYILPGMLLDSALSWVATQLKPGEITMDPEHAAFLASIGVTLHRMNPNTLSDLSSMVFPNSVTSIPLLPPGLQISGEVPSGSISSLSRQFRILLNRTPRARPAASVTAPVAAAALDPQTISNRLWALIKTCPPEIYEFFRADSNIPELGAVMPDHPPAAVLDILYNAEKQKLRRLGEIVRETDNPELFAAKYREIHQAKIRKSQSLVNKIKDVLPLLFSAVPLFALRPQGSPRPIWLGLLGLGTLAAAVVKFPSRQKTSNAFAPVPMTGEEMDEIIAFWESEQAQKPSASHNRPITGDEMDQLIEAANLRPHFYSDKVLPFIRRNQQIFMLTAILTAATSFMMHRDPHARALHALGPSA